jgi:hypothetical protein
MCQWQTLWQNLPTWLTPWRKRYEGHPEAVILACYFNPQNSIYRFQAFQRFYQSIRHLNHEIVECVIGDEEPQLPQSPHIQVLHTPSLLWHKEGLINYLLARIPSYYRYVFWLDADILFTNPLWLIQSIAALQKYTIVQPFEYGIHLEQDELKPSFDLELARQNCHDLDRRHPRLWRSFAANHALGRSGVDNYHLHGHVGFAWGARREVLTQAPLFDRALIGGADHIMAHAAVGQIPHPCISKAFTENLDEVIAWSERFYAVTEGRLGYVAGDLYHLWHGPLENRQYLQRIRDFTPRSQHIQERDESGLYINHDDDDYMRAYFAHREVSRFTNEPIEPEDWVADLPADDVLPENFLPEDMAEAYDSAEEALAEFEANELSAEIFS